MLTRRRVVDAQLHTGLFPLAPLRLRLYLSLHLLPLGRGDASELELLRQPLLALLRGLLHPPLALLVLPQPHIAGRLLLRFQPRRQLLLVRGRPLLVAALVHQNRRRELARLGRLHQRRIVNRQLHLRLSTQELVRLRAIKQPATNASSFFVLNFSGICPEPVLSN